MGVLLKDKTAIIGIEEGEKFHDKLIVFDWEGGFYNFSKLNYLYSTMTDLLVKSNLDSSLTDKFVTINHYLNCINKLHLDNFNLLEENLDDYYKMYDEFSLNVQNPVLHSENVFGYTQFDLEFVSEFEFGKIFSGEISQKCSKESSLYALSRNDYLQCIFPEDTLDKYKRRLYMFLKSTGKGFDFDMAYSFKNFIGKISNFSINYHERFTSISMDKSGFHTEHIVAINKLLTAYNHLLNSCSFLNNTLLHFDEINIDRRIESARLTVVRVPELIKHRLEANILF